MPWPTLSRLKLCEGPNASAGLLRLNTVRQLKESQEAVKLRVQSAPLGIVSGGYLDWSLPVAYSSRYENQEASEVIIHFAKKKKSLFLSSDLFYESAGSKTKPQL